VAHIAVPTAIPVQYQRSPCFPDHVSAACLRLHGPSTAEVPLLAVRPEVQRNKLGSVLLAVLEALVAAVSRRAAAPPAPTAASAEGGADQEGCPADVAGARDTTAGQGEALLLTPAFWGPGSPYLAYPPGQPGVPDVVPIRQARWVSVCHF